MRPVEHDRRRVDPRMSTTELLSTQPDGRCTPHAFELLAIDSGRGVYRSRGRARAHLTHHDECTALRDHIELQAANAHVAPTDREATLL